MNQKWNLQDIQPAKPRKQRREPVDVAETKKPAFVDPAETDNALRIAIADGRKKKSRSLLYALILFVVIVGAGFGASALLGGAELTVHPRFKEPNVNALFTAVRTPQPDELTYEIMTLEAEGERQVTASGQEEVTSQAEGTILIYNEQQTSPLRLVTNTRFQTGDGLIFKIKDSAVVPGYTTADDGSKVPGVTTAEVFAEEAGEEYNVAPTRFTIPGFAGEPEFETVYAESVETMSGGFAGLKFIIDDTELQTAQQALRLELRNSLLERIQSEIPAGFVWFEGAITFTYVSLPSVEFGDNLATIKEKALMRIPLFAEDAFAEYIAAATVPGYEGNPVRIESTDTLTFAYDTATTSASDISLADSLDFNLTGRPLIVWTYDEALLKADLLNAPKTALSSILGGYPAIEKGKAVIRPFWKTKFPTDLDEITIIEELDRAGE